MLDFVDVVPIPGTQVHNDSIVVLVNLVPVRGDRLNIKKKDYLVVGDLRRKDLKGLFSLRANWDFGFMI